MKQRVLPRLVTRIEDVVTAVNLIKERGKFVYDYETLGTKPYKGRISGLGLAWGPTDEEACYILIEHVEHPYLPWDEVWPVVREIFEDESILQIAHNWLFDAAWNIRFGAKLHTNIRDTMIMLWLQDTERVLGLKPTVHEFYDYKMTDLSDIAAKETVSWHPGKVYRLDKIPIDDIENYAVDDVVWTWRLHDDLWQRIESDKTLRKVWDELYREVLVTFAEMQDAGVRIDVPLLRELEEAAIKEHRELEEELLQLRPGQDFDPDLAGFTGNIDVDRKNIPELQKKWADRKNLREKLYERPELAHKLFNPNSNTQLNTILFDELGLTPVGELSKQNLYSTNRDSLVAMVAEDETGFVSTFLRYRKVEKLVSQYLTGLQPWVDPDSRVRTSFRITLKTGRAAGSDPSLLNISNDDVYPVRKAFVARPGYKLVVADYSQIELRVMAHLADEKQMIEGFHQGYDPHSITAYAVFQPEDSTAADIPEKHPNLRRIAKVINFGVLYGMGPGKLAKDIAQSTEGEVNPTLKQAEGYMESLFTRMPGVRRFIRQTENFAKRHGYVKTILGRPRHTKAALQFDNRAAHFGALRAAVNGRIQPSAADIIMLAMRNIRRHYVERGLWMTDVRMILQVHDELVFEVREDIAETEKDTIVNLMTNVVRLKVPLDVSAEIADNWHEGK